VKEALGRIAAAANRAAERVGKAPISTEPMGGFDIENDWGGIITSIGVERVRITTRQETVSTH
jgi:hypothetical protein